MTITIGSFTCTTLTAQPFGYEGTARSGLTARTFRITGLLTPTQWQALLSAYNTWRDTRITDADTASSGTVGTTINLTISANGVSVSALPCWFADPPTGEQVGTYINANVLLVDAAQALEVLLRDKEKARQSQDLPNLGTLTLGSATITLTKPLETRQDGPNVALTAGGTSYITGALKAHKVRAVEGFISSGSLSDLLSWYDTAISSIPSTNTWFPVSPPQATAEVIVSGGAKSTRYNVTLTALQII